MQLDQQVNRIDPTFRKPHIALIKPSRGASDKVTKLIGDLNGDWRQPSFNAFPDVFQLLKNAQANFWLPTEIGMGDDGMQYKTGVLTQSERFLFELNISYLSASDSLVPDNLMHSIMENISANEMRQYLRWQMAEEANHLNSYHHILDSIGVASEDRDLIFSMYRNNDAIREKLNWNLRRTQDLVNCNYPIGTLEKVRELFKNILAYHVFEFLFFPCSFANVFALAETGKMKNTASQYQYIWRDENLHALNARFILRHIITVEYPKIWTDSFKKECREIIAQSVELESVYAKEVMPDGGITAMSVANHIEYAKYLANVICGSLGLQVLYGNVTSNPLKFMSKYQDIKTEQNFFEGRVIDYQKGATLKWD